METKTTSSDQIKTLVKEQYAKIAEQDYATNSTSCCGAGGCGDTAVMAENYEQIEGYVKDADLGLGCGLPTAFAQINEGDTVIDLGSGAGNDAFIARSVTGATGKVIGIDFTETMIAKARLNAQKMKYNNVEFRYGDIEEMPVADNEADVIVSNCVLNLVPNKANVFAEIFRTLKPGGHFSISDIVLSGTLPKNLQEAAAMYAGCVSGAIQMDEYLNLITAAGFENVVLQKEKVITLPPEVLSKYLDDTELLAFHKSNTKIVSITVYAEKPGTKESKKNAEKEEKSCCGPECCN
jgi:SAM-dependent methyltransferase